MKIVKCVLLSIGVVACISSVSQAAPTAQQLTNINGVLLSSPTLVNAISAYNLTYGPSTVVNITVSRETNSTDIGSSSDTDCDITYVATLSNGAQITAADSLPEACN